MDRIVAYEGTKLTIAYAREKNGDVPGAAFFEALSLSEKAKVQSLFVLLADKRTTYNPEKFGDLGEGLYEFKSFQIRMPFAYAEQERGIVLITYRFRKKKNKTPSAEIERAPDPERGCRMESRKRRVVSGQYWSKKMQSQHEILMQDPEFRKELTVETFILECTELLSRVMRERQISKADLARRLGKSRAWVTQLLSGGRNVTARTLAEVAYELGAQLSLETRDLQNGGASVQRRESSESRLGTQFAREHRGPRLRSSTLSQRPRANGARGPVADAKGRLQLGK